MPLFRRLRVGDLAGLALAATMVVVVWALWRMGRGTTFFYDEWDFVTQRRSGAWDAFLSPHNGHLSLVPALAYRLLFATVGLEHYGVYRAMGIALHIGCVALLYVYARKRLSSGASFMAAAALLLLGRAWEVLLWPFTMATLCTVGAGIAALLLLDRGSGRGDVAAAVLLAFALASFSFAIPIVLGLTAELILRRQFRHRWPVVVVPSLLYGAWYLFYGDSETARSGFAAIPGYVSDAAAGASAALFGLSTRGTLLAGGIAAVCLMGLMRRAVDRPRLLMFLITVLSFWSMTGLTRGEIAGNSPASSRYLYPGGAFIILALVESLRGLRTRRPAMAAAFGVFGFVAHSNIEVLRDGAAGLRDTAMYVRSELAAVELARPPIPADFTPDSVRMPQVTAGPYLAAVAELGSPADTMDALRARPELVRAAFDNVSARAMNLQLHSLGKTDSATTAVVEGMRRGSCQTSGRRGSTDIGFRLRAGTVGIRTSDAPAEIRFRRVASEFPADPLITVPSASVVQLTVRADRAQVPWHVSIRSSSATTVCR